MYNALRNAALRHFSPRFVCCQRNTSIKNSCSNVGLSFKSSSSQPRFSCPFRNASEQKKMPREASDYMFRRFYDEVHFYLMLGLIPTLLLVFFVNVFIGPAELTDIPDGYEPHYWEYHKHPISRFIAKYITVNPQKAYEATMGQLDDYRVGKEIVEEERWFRKAQHEHDDYRGWFFIPVNPVGVNRSFEKLQEDQEAGSFAAR
ncbi:unnamed protein product [Trichobilharzia szidati]|nr:unnamed protein product [Trichobilharzia szidati]